MINGYIYAAVAALVAGYIVMTKISLSEAETKIENLRTELLNTHNQMSSLKSSLKSSNKIISDMQIDLETKDAELQEWRRKPTKARYETIYRDVVRDTNLTGECDEVKNIINSVSSINLNTL